MGRKIPAKKHHGVKDPLKQQEERLKRLKTKINAPPRDPDEQPAPRSLERLFRLPRDQAATPHKQNYTRNKKHDHKNKEVHNNASSAKNPVSSLKRLPGESGRAFSLRINSALRTLNTHHRDHYPSELNEDEDDTKGLHMSERRERRAKKRARSGAGGVSEAPGGGGRPTRGQLLTRRKKEKKEKAAEEASLSRAEVTYERVSFGDVAHAPPALSVAPRRAAPRDGAPRPATRPLLLHALLPPAAKEGERDATRERLRTLPPAERMRRERARQDAVSAYRALKHAGKQTKIKLLI